MKKPAFALLLASAMFHPVMHAAPEPAWDAEVRQFDDAYWAAYNRCDINASGRGQVRQTAIFELIQSALVVLPLHRHGLTFARESAA